MTSLNREQIIALELSDRKYVRAKKIYIDMAGDLIAGIVLSEVVYWHTPGKGGKQRLRIIEGKTDRWLACRRQGWWDRARITARQFDRALDKLVKVGLIIRDHFDYKGQSTLHVRINWDTFEKLYNALLEVPAQRKRRIGITKQSHPDRVLPDGDTLSPIGNTELPDGETDSPHGDTYTRIDTTKETTIDKSKDYAPFGAGLETRDPISLVKTPSKESPANAGDSMPPQSSAKIPPSVSRWNDAQLNTYYVENKVDIDIIASALGVIHDRVPFKNRLVGDKRDTVKVHMTILARQLEVIEYIKFLREKHFGWRKQFCVSLKELTSTIAIYESQLYPIKDVSSTPIVTDEERANMPKTFAEVQANLLGKGRAS